MKKIIKGSYLIKTFLLLAIFLVSAPSYATICDDIAGSVIDVDLFSPDNKGVVDASSAIQMAFDCFIAKIVTSDVKSGEIVFSPGMYKLDQRIELVGLSNTSSDDFENLVISGVGTQAVTFNVNNDDGGILIDMSNYRTGAVEFRNLKFSSLKNGGGTAIDVSQPAGGNQHRRNFIARDIEITSYNVSSNYFNNGIKLTGVWRPLIENVFMTGPFGPNAINQFKTNACFDLTDTYSPAIINSRCWSANIGVNLQGTNAGNPEGITISSSKFVTTNIGINIATTGYEPEAFISNNHINSQVRGIILNRRTKAIIDGNLMYNDYTNNSFYQDILVFDAKDVIVTNNTFFNAKTEDHVSRTAIRVANGSENIIINDNLFRNEGYGVSIGSGVTGTRVINNHFIGTSINVSDFGTGTINSSNY